MVLIIETQSTSVAVIDHFQKGHMIHKVLNHRSHSLKWFLNMCLVYSIEKDYVLVLPVHIIALNGSYIKSYNTGVNLASLGWWQH